MEVRDGGDELDSVEHVVVIVVVELEVVELQLLFRHLVLRLLVNTVHVFHDVSETREAFRVRLQVCVCVCVCVCVVGVCGRACVCGGRVWACVCECVCVLRVSVLEMVCVCVRVCACLKSVGWSEYSAPKRVLPDFAEAHN